MELEYLYSAVSFFVGIASGFQGVYERYARESLQASLTPPGALYCLSRGVVPALVFAVSYGQHWISGNLFLFSLACGASIEVVLRMKFYVRTSKTEKGAEELMRGPFDLLKWYQNLLLQSTAQYIATDRLRFVQSHLPQNIDFHTLVSNAINNSSALPEDADRDKLSKQLERLVAEYGKEVQGQNGELDKVYRFKLGYLVLSEQGRIGFKLLFTII